MKTDYEKELRIEKEKLNRLIDEALKNGTPISKTQSILQQSSKGDKLILKRIENCE